MMHSNAFPDRSLVIIDVEEKKKKKNIGDNFLQI